MKVQPCDMKSANSFPMVALLTEKDLNAFLCLKNTSLTPP
jgi:hypothetical protein